ncbi:MAG: diacylglycerol kinase family protein [Anaerotignaceae bacterium]
MTQKALFVFNPCSGKGTIKTKLFDIIDTLSVAGYEVTVCPTQKRRDGYEIVHKKGSAYSLLVVSGGDGTLNECVNGLLEIPEDKRPVVGYIPTGSTNDFASTLKIPKKPSGAVSNIVNGKEFKCDVGRFNQNCFVYIAAFGAFTDVAYDTPQEIKNYLGHMAYILEGIKRLPNIKSHRLLIEHDGVAVEEDFIYGMISNSTFVGGVRSYRNHTVDLADGLFECVLIREPENAIDLQAIITGLLMQDFSFKAFYTFRAQRVNIQSEEVMSWTLDGEYGGDHNKVEIENLHQAMTIMVGEKKAKKIEVFNAIL